MFSPLRYVLEKGEREKLKTLIFIVEYVEKRFVEEKNTYIISYQFFDTISIQYIKHRKYFCQFTIHQCVINLVIEIRTYTYICTRSRESGAHLQIFYRIIIHRAWIIITYTKYSFLHLKSKSCVNSKLLSYL